MFFFCGTIVALARKVAAELEFNGGVCNSTWREICALPYRDDEAFIMLMDDAFGPDGWDLVAPEARLS